MTHFNRFVQEVDKLTLDALADPRLPLDQQRLLRATVERVQRYAACDDAAQPLGLLYLTLRAWRNDTDERALQLGAFTSLYLCAGDLFDDVEDDDLEQTPHRDTGPAIAVNNAIALMFLAFDALRKAMSAESNADLRVRYLEAFNRVSLLGVGCQHSDLLGARAATTPEEVLALHKGKTSTIALYMELGALLAGCSNPIVESYRKAGESLAGLVQILDDIRDIYGKSESPDLAGRKLTFPVACFLQRADAAQRAHWETLLAQLPHSLDAIRILLHEAGSIELCAEHMESLRVEFHEAIAATGNSSPSHRLLLRVVDTLAGAIYQPEPLAVSRGVLQPSGGFHSLVQVELARFTERVSAFYPHSVAVGEPWHLSHFNYDHEGGVIYYPDLDGLSDELLPFYEQLYGLSHAAARATIEELLPLIAAHEMFHHLRQKAGLLTEDKWHEEYVANRLMTGYARTFAPSLLLKLRALGRTVCGIHTLSSAQLAVLHRCSSPSVERRDYEMGQTECAVLHFTMVERLSQPLSGAPSGFLDDLRDFLGATPLVVAAE